MAKTSSRTNVKVKPKPIGGNTGKAMKIADEYFIPKSPADVAMYLIPYGKIAKSTAKVVKKVIKPTKAIKASTATKKVTPRKRKMF
jgi:hypothetical protein